MNPAIKAVVAVLVIALIAVVGLIVVTRTGDAPQPEPTATPMATQTPQETAAPEPTQTSDEPQAAADTGDEAQEDAQGTMYEGALAGLSDEEIAKLAMAEEASAARTDETTGVEDPVD